MANLIECIGSGRTFHKRGEYLDKNEVSTLYKVMFRDAHGKRPWIVEAKTGAWVFHDKTYTMVELFDDLWTIDGT